MRYRALVFALVVGVVVGGLLVAAVAVDDATESPMVTDTPAQPLVVDVSPEEVRTSATVTYRVRSVPGTEVASNASGLLTRVEVREGELVTSGSTLVEVNDRPIVAMVSDRPLYRSLSTGDQGPDVRALEGFLADLGLLEVAADDFFGSDTARAVTEFNLRHRHPVPTDVFDVASIAWLGPHPLRATRIVGHAGQQVQPGQPLVVGPPRPLSIAVVEPEQGIARVPGGFALHVGEVSVRYRAGSGEIVGHRAVRRLAAAAPTTREGIAEVVSVRGERVIRVPASAVVADADGSLCVFASAAGPPIQVTPIRGQLSVVDLPAASGLRRVLVNPAATRSSAACD